MYDFMMNIHIGTCGNTICHEKANLSLEARSVTSWTLQDRTRNLNKTAPSSPSLVLADEASQSLALLNC